MSDLCCVESQQQEDTGANNSAQEGQSLVELALLLPVLLLIMAGVLDLGRAFHAYITITNAAREGARYASLHPEDTAGVFDRASQEAENSGIDLCGPGSPCVLDFPEIAPGEPITVTVEYEFEPITGLIFGGQAFTIGASAAMVQF